MKILVAIANYGQKNRAYVEALLSSYRSMPYQVDIVILSNEPKDFGHGVEVLVGLPSKNPWSLPFAHKSLFAERISDYDLFIYSEDDTLITQKNTSAFLDAARILPTNEIPGFLRYETAKDGSRYISSAHGAFHWQPESAKLVESNIFAQFTNAHSACFILTREHLHRAIASGGFLVSPHEGDYDMLCSAATDPYTRCGLTKVVNVSRIEDFLLPHLPNKYVGTMGLAYPHFQAQIEALKQIANGARSPVRAIPNMRLLPLKSPWAKNYYEPCSKHFLDLIPRGSRSILSLGAGAGATECELARLGFQVTAIPLDSVISASAETNGVEMVDCELRRGPEVLRSRRFDCVIIQNSLYLMQDPGSLISSFSGLLSASGYFLATEPNFGSIQTCIRRLVGVKGFQNLGSFDRSGVTPITLRRLLRWMESAGLVVQRIVRTPDDFTSGRLRTLRSLPIRYSAKAITVLARRK